MASVGYGPVLEAVARRRLDPRASEWLERALAAGGADRAAFLECFTAAARRLGKAALALLPEEARALREAGIDWSLEGWAIDELGRVAMILRAAARRPADQLAELLEECYRRGDNRERQAVLRSLPCLPEADRFLALAVDACRSHVQPVFEAIACENPYPARHFPELNFNQMVLKALFTGVALSRIVGLEARVTPELTRMARDFASERRAAGRPVPSDIGRLLGAGGSQP